MNSSAGYLSFASEFAHLCSESIAQGLHVMSSTVHVTSVQVVTRTAEHYMQQGPGIVLHS